MVGSVCLLGIGNARESTFLLERGLTSMTLWHIRLVKAMLRLAELGWLDNRTALGDAHHASRHYVSLGQLLDIVDNL